MTSFPLPVFSDQRTLISPVEFVIVGGGPVGLWTAVQLKRRQPGCDVVVYERHEHYQRHHVLRLEHWSLLLYGHGKGSHPEDEAFYRAVTQRSWNGTRRHPTDVVTLRTSELESALQDYARALGVNVRHALIDDARELMKRHPGCSHFIAADGARSRMREQLWPAPTTIEQPLQHLIEMKYQVQGPVDTSRGKKIRARMEHLAFDHVGRSRDGKTPATLRLFVPEEVYRELPDASFKAPIGLRHPRLPEAVRADLTMYLTERHTSHGEAICEEDIKLSKLILSIYAAPTFARAVDDKSWFLVGDAAMGVPYFRALNSGLILGSRLAQILLPPQSWAQSFQASPLVRYNRYRPWHVRTEFALARAKDTGVQAYARWRELIKSEKQDHSDADPNDDLPDGIWAPDCRAS